MNLNPTQLQQHFTFSEEGPFRSHNELKAAISSPLYAADAHYRAKVETKLGITDRAQWGLSEKRPTISYTHAAPAVVDEDFSW